MAVRRWMMIVVVGFLLEGCGAGSSPSSSPGPGGTQPPPVVLQSISIQPGDSTLNAADTLLLSAVGHMSDGQVVPVNADWSLTDPAILSLGATVGVSSTLATALGVGTCQVTAVSQTFTAHVTLTVDSAIPTDPGVVHALSNVQVGILRYPAGGGAAQGIWGDNFGDGFVVDRAGVDSYVILSLGDGTQAIDRYNLSTGGPIRVGSLPADSGGYFCLDYDSQDRLYTINGSSGTLVRIDPVTSSTTPLGVVSGSTVITMAIGPDDRIYGCTLFDGGGNRIFRFDPATGVQDMWALIPGYTGLGGFVIPGGLTMNRQGEAFIASFVESEIYRCIDVNGDGDARDGGEVTRFATLPTGTYDGNSYPNVLGVATTGGASLLVNVDLSTTGASAGVYWLADRDDSGTCDGAGELTLWSPDRVNNLRSGNCIQSRR